VTQEWPGVPKKQEHYHPGPEALPVSFLGPVVVLAVLAALVMTGWGLVTSRRSAAVGVVALAVALVASVGSWYSWAESNSLPWDAGYGLVALAALASATRQLGGLR
jgi:hypothetical protein